MEDEIWRDVIGYEGLYEVSNHGRVRSLKYRKTGEPKLLKVNNKRYASVVLCKNNTTKDFLVHRLVAEAFIPNPDGLPQVNHIDEDKSNNCVWNLEWCTRKYNNDYGTRTERIAKAMIGKLINHPSLSKRVYQYTLNGSFVRSYASTREAERRTGIDHNSISMCCNGKYNHAGSYIWSYDPPAPTTVRSLF